jgi:nitrogen fixation NifU-like protein
MIRDPLDAFAEQLQQKIDATIESTYSELVVHHWKNPKNWGIMDKADGYGRFTGPCGDTMEISIKVSGDVITSCTFDTDGCGPTIACGSIVTTMATGKKIALVKQFDQRAVLTYCGGLPTEHTHCALLAVTTLHRAIKDLEPIRTQPWKRFYKKH